MKKFAVYYLSALAVALSATASFAQFTDIKETAAGTIIGRTAAKKISFYGATPVPRPASTNSVRQALEKEGLIAPGGSDTTNTDALSKVADDTVTDGVDYTFGTSTGSKLGTAANQKLAAYGITPVVQPAAAAQAAVAGTVGGAVGSQTGYTTVASLKTIFITGVAAPGAATATGLAVGDTVKAVINLSDTADAKADFEATVTVVNQLQQSSASDYSTKKFLVVAAANSTTDIAALKTLTNAAAVDAAANTVLVNAIRTGLVNTGWIKGAP
jgi:hypothetical protein